MFATTTSNSASTGAGQSPSPQRTSGSRRPIVVIAVLLTAAALWWAQDMLIPLVIAVLITYTLDPLHRRLVSWGIANGISASLLLALLLGVLGTGVYVLGDQATTFAGQLPTVAQKMRDLVRGGSQSPTNPVGQVQQAASKLKKAADESAPPPPRGVTRVQVEEPPLRWIDLAWRGSLGAIAIGIQAIIILFLVFYLLASGDLYK